MVSNKELENVVEQINAAYARLDKRIAALEAAQASATCQERKLKKDLTFGLFCGIVQRYNT